MLESKIIEIKKLKTRIACLVHEDNADHLERQQSITSYSSSHQSVSSQSSFSSYKESSCVSTYRQSKPVSGHRQTRSVPSHRARRCSQSLSASSYEQERSVPSHRTRREADDVETRRKQQTDYISRIGSTVDTLAKLYSPARYIHVSTIIEYDAAGPTVMDVFPALCLYVGEEEPTSEELAKYDSYLASQLRPDPIYSPTLQKPRVDWTRVNKWKLRDLPESHTFPILSVPQDPDYYKTTFAKKYGDIVGCSGLPNVPGACGCFNCIPPFGKLRGYRSNHGILPMPKEPVHGYVWTSCGGWVLYAGGNFGLE